MSDCDIRPLLLGVVELTHDAVGPDRALPPLLPRVYEGRPPEGLCTNGEVDAPDLQAAWLARSAHYEAASIHAFLRLAQSLERLGAPEWLREGALEAARDEVRHARIMTTLAYEAGAKVQTPCIFPLPLPDLGGLAIDNAVHGCVNETWSAALALWQARNNPDPKLREHMAAIAEDELRHAQLAWDIDRWAEDQLPEDRRAEVKASLQGALAHIEGGLSEAEGQPGQPIAATLFANLREALWARA